MAQQDGDAQAAVLEQPYSYWALVFGATLLGAALRLHGLETPSLWVDEFFSIARAGADPMHWTYALGYQPTVLSLWMSGADLGGVSLDNITEWQALGVTERGARLGACWVGILTIPILALLARPVLGGGVAGASALLIAIMPYHLYWSQMARYYTTEFLFANAFLLLLARGVQTGGRASFAAASAAGLLAFASHFTAVFPIGACFGVAALAWLARVRIPNLGAAVTTLALTTSACGLLLLVKEVASPAPSTLGAFATQSWDPSLRTLVLGTVLRVEPVVFVVGLCWIAAALRRRDPLALLMGVAALLVPIGVLALKPFFPVGQRYYFSSLYPWAVLAAMWSVELDRRLTPSLGRVAGVAGLLAVVVSVGFSSFLYSRDGAGGRTRWRDAYEYVLRHAEPDDPVYARPGGFQAQYYLERPASDLSLDIDPGSLAPGSWVVYRTRGAQQPPFGPPLEKKARYEIPSKPWSFVLYVLRVPRT